MIKNIFTPLAVLFVAISSLVGCADEQEAQPQVTVTQTIPAPSQDDPATPEAATSNEDLYLLGIKSMNNPILNVATDAQLLEMGYSVCEALNAGFTVEDIIDYMARQMFSEGMTSDAEVEAVGYIIGAADTALCPSATF